MRTSAIRCETYRSQQRFTIGSSSFRSGYNDWHKSIRSRSDTVSLRRGLCLARLSIKADIRSQWNLSAGLRDVNQSLNLS
ncbi:unnamed protein product [Anisakis simplex]|uniref:Uncharacterized protein n=1 Tax=Anisakis simplex TaxID=6269 RepID=A0A0M3K395_ANISI|nr:unnamed protein product [Anisakis simplex]